MQILDFSTTHAQITDEVINVSNSNAVGLDHDLFYNKTGKLGTVYTATGGGGTQLTEGTDYEINDAFADSDLPTSISPDVAYTTIAITNATYHSTDLYVNYYPIGDVISAARWNVLARPPIASISADYTITDSDGYRYIHVTTGATDRTITLPTATDNDQRVLTIKKVDSGAGTVTIDGDGTEEIDGETTKLLTTQYSYMELICDGTGWNVMSFYHAPYDSGWTSNSDWTNAEFTITHNLNTDISNLSIKMYLSSDGTENGAFETTQSGYNTSANVLIDTGVAFYQTDNNVFVVQTGASGVLMVTSGTGIISGIDTETYYYKIVVYKLTP